MRIINVASYMTTLQPPSSVWFQPMGTKYYTSWNRFACLHVDTIKVLLKMMIGGSLLQAYHIALPLPAFVPGRLQKTAFLSGRLNVAVCGIVHAF